MIVSLSPVPPLLRPHIAKSQWISACDEVASKRLRLVSNLLLGGGSGSGGNSGKDVVSIQPLVADLQSILLGENERRLQLVCGSVTSGHEVVRLACSVVATANEGSRGGNGGMHMTGRSGVKRFREATIGGGGERDGSAGINFCMRSIADRLRLLLIAVLRQVVDGAKSAGVPPSEVTTLLGPHLDAIIGLSCCDFVYSVPSIGADSPAATKVLRLLISRLSAAGLALTFKGAVQSGGPEQDLVAFSGLIRVCVGKPDLSDTCRSVVEGTAPSLCHTELESLPSEDLVRLVLAFHTTTTTTGGQSKTISTAPKSTTMRAEGCVLSESNFKLFCYSSGPESMVCRVLSHFSEPQFHIKSSTADGYLYFSQYHLTRGGFMKALKMGIAADQVVNFLTLWAHESMRGLAAVKEGASVVPQAIIDQLQTWEFEHKRITLARNGEEVVRISCTNPDMVSVIRGLVQKWAASSGHGDKQGSDGVLFSGACEEGVVSVVLPMLVYLHAVRPHLNTPSTEE